MKNYDHNSLHNYRPYPNRTELGITVKTFQTSEDRANSIE